MDLGYQLRSEQFLSLEKLLGPDKTRPELRDSGWITSQRKDRVTVTTVSDPEQGLGRLWLDLLAIGPGALFLSNL